MVESNGQRSAAAGLFRVPGLFVRLSSSSSKGGGGVGDPDSVWSPTSPLDFKNLRSSPPRVGLGLVDALTADETGALRPGGRSSFLDSIRPFLDLALPKSKTAASSAAGVAPAATTLDEGVMSDYDADSEEYTCVIARGANPRTTHILAGGTVEVRSNGAVGGGGCGKKVLFNIVPLSDDQQPSTSSSPPGAASGRCCCCMKRLPEDRDIFMYMGEKAFCSDECRRGYIEEEEIEEAEELITLEPGLVNL
ncbi:hypothetical protein U9M48_017899 [Paspalum notatum var. saurae]|uniref:FLZ-type domain-containing protein n=1 Tax=Paspalum notatum var. saurae TaxID=547442 RepID=A0AAQ3T8Y1_PASNO